MPAEFCGAGTASRATVRLVKREWRVAKRERRAAKREGWVVTREWQAASHARLPTETIGLDNSFKPLMNES